MAFQSALDRLHGFFAKRNALLIHLAAELDDGMDAFPRHTLGPFQHCLDIDQLRPIPVQFQNTPTPFNWIVFAVIGRVIQQVDWFANLVGKLHHAVQKLRATPTALRPVIHFDLEQPGGRLCLLIQGFPLGGEYIDDEVTGFVRTAERNGQLPSIFIHDPTRNILLLAPQVVITGVGITPSETTARKITDVHGGFTIDTQAFDVLPCRGLGVFFLMLSKMASVS